MNNKFSIGVVVAIVLQVSAFVWWTAQQAQTIQTLEKHVAELTAKSQIEKEVQLKSDVAMLKKELKALNDKTLQAVLDANDRIDNLGAHVNAQDVLINDTLANDLRDFAGKVENSFHQIEEWIDEQDIDIIEVRDRIMAEIRALDKKLMDKIDKK
jgi:hypothetical protein